MELVPSLLHAIVGMFEVGVCINSWQVLEITHEMPFAEIYGIARCQKPTENPRAHLLSLSTFVWNGYLN